MSQPPARDVAFACITHVPLRFDYPDFVTPLFLGQQQGEGRLNLRELAPEWQPHHPILGGTAGSFALKAWVQRERPEAHWVGLCQYRKFVSRQRLSSMPAPNYPSMDAVHKSDLSVQRLAQCLLPDGEDFLVCGSIALSDGSEPIGQLKQYAHAHRAEDLLRFTAAAVELGVLDSLDAEAFLTERTFIPGGLELGVFPAPFWLRSIAAVEAVVRACIQRYPLAREGYQVRAWSFCAERLGSWMLLREFRAGRRAGALEGLQRWRWSRRFCGQLNLVIEDDAARYVIGT